MKKISILLLSSALLLSGCSGHTTSISNGDKKLMTIGDTSYTNQDVYSLLKSSKGASEAISEIQSVIYDKEVKQTKALKEEADKQYESYKNSSEQFKKSLKAEGYTKKTYIKQYIMPSLQAEKLLDKYFDANKKAIKKEYKPCMAVVLQTDDKKTAKKALKALKSGTSESEVFSQYASSNANFSDSDTLITTKSTGVPTRLVNTLAKQKKTGLVDEIFESDDDDSSQCFIAILKTNKYKDVKSSLKDNLSSDSDLATECMQYYLKKYNFEIHDQTIFDYMRNNNPEFLVNHPELQKNSDK